MQFIDASMDEESTVKKVQLISLGDHFIKNRRNSKAIMNLKSLSCERARNIPL